MFNSLEAKEGPDFSYVSSKDIKNKLSPSLIAFWEVVESQNMDVVAADGHPLGKTFKFKININQNPNYQSFFDQVLKEPLYSDYAIDITDLTPGELILVSFELLNLQNRI